MKAVNHYVVVDKIKVEQKKVAGLIMTENIDEDNRYLRGKVISAGNLAEFLNEGDIVHYDKHAGHGIEHKGEKYHIIRFQDVVVVL